MSPESGVAKTLVYGPNSQRNEPKSPQSSTNGDMMNLKPTTRPYSTLDEPVTVSQTTRVFNRGINMLKAEEGRLLKKKKNAENPYLANQVKVLDCVRSRPRQMQVLQTLAEQKPRPSTPAAESSSQPQNDLDKRPAYASNKQENVFSKVRLKRNTAAPAQNDYSGAVLLGSLPIIPEKGDPSVAI